MLYRITLHLARNAEFPSGSARHGYEIVAPLDDAGHLDGQDWRRNAVLCTVRRFWSGEEDRTGRLIHRPGGVGGATWMIDYDDASSEDDETGYRFDRHSFVRGEYVTVTDRHGSHTFRVVEVEQADE